MTWVAIAWSYPVKEGPQVIDLVQQFLVFRAKELQLLLQMFLLLPGKSELLMLKLLLQTLVMFLLDKELKQPAVKHVK